MLIPNGWVDNCMKPGEHAFSPGVHWICFFQQLNGTHCSGPLHSVWPCVAMHASSSLFMLNETAMQTGYSSAELSQPARRALCLTMCAWVSWHHTAKLPATAKSAKFGSVPPRKGCSCRMSCIGSRAFWSSGTCLPPANCTPKPSQSFEGQVKPPKRVRACAAHQ